MYRLATCFWVSLRTLSPQGLSIAPEYWLVRYNKVMVFMEREHYKTSTADLPSVNKIQMRRLSRISRKWMEVKGRSCVSYMTMLLGY